MKHPTVHLNSRNTEYMSARLNPCGEELLKRVAVKETFSLMSVLTLISTVPKETIQIIFVAIICAWRQKRKNRFNSTLVVIDEE